MAITAVTASSWSDVQAFLAGMKDISNANFFTDVVLDNTNNVLKLFTADSATDPLCEISTVSSTLVLHYYNNGSPTTLNGVIKYSQYGGSISFPCTMYKCPWGCLIDIIGQGQHFLFGVCKTNNNKIGIITSNQQNDIPNSKGVADGVPATGGHFKVIGLHTYDSIVPSSSEVFYISYGSTGVTNSLKDKPFTALIPIVPYANTPDYSKNTYLNLFTQGTAGTYGSYEYQGHTYLTNGLISILDT